jgi:N-acetylmuramic acid 6-phosphate etherase
VEKALNEIAAAVDVLANALKNGGRIFYTGAGTSGRLGVLDASECPPTYGVSPDTVQGILAGGPKAAFCSIEDAEDDFESIVSQLKEKDFCEKDVLVAISASGSANCVKGAIDFAKNQGSRTICISCNRNSDLIPMCEIAIIAEVGPEVINGSTRMKAGTAQKMILNMLSTGAMVRFGRVRGNYMAYMVPSNIKLVDRAIRIISAKTGVSYERAKEELEKANNVIADAIDNIEEK